MRTIRVKDTGPAVRDVQKRLRLLGYEVALDGNFGDRTEQAVCSFKKNEGLSLDPVVDEKTWAALVDATFPFGDRMLYLRMPFFHGADVYKLQNILNTLGFVTGDPDGIFGAHTEYALREFQSSVGLPADGVAGDATYDAIDRLRHAWEGKQAINPSAAPEHMGLVRVAEVLENNDICLFGVDEIGHSVAHRISNLAKATTSQARLMTADELQDTPSMLVYMIGFGAEEHLNSEDRPRIAYSDTPDFTVRFATAAKSMQDEETYRRLFIEVPLSGQEDYGPIEGERWEQHLAVALLDAICAALSSL